MPESPNAQRRISENGLALIEEFEGFVPHWYNDAVGVRTIGYGWTGKLPAGFTAPLTQAEARALLRLTVQDYEACVRAAVKVPLSQNAYDALVSFTYNLGCGNLGKSTLVRKLNAGQTLLAANEFLRWNKAGGRVLAGLTRRRKAEQALFLTPDPEPEKPDPREGAEDVERVEPRPPEPFPQCVNPEDAR